MRLDGVHHAIARVWLAAVQRGENLAGRDVARVVGRLADEGWSVRAGRRNVPYAPRPSSLPSVHPATRDICRRGVGSTCRPMLLSERDDSATHRGECVREERRKRQGLCPRRAR